jgi:CHASE3 domain sensor protein
VASAAAIMRGGQTSKAVDAIAQASQAMRIEEDSLFAERTKTADRTQLLASIVTVVGSALVIALAAISIVLVRRSSRARDNAEARLRDNNLNLEATVD